MYIPMLVVSKYRYTHRYPQCQQIQIDADTKICRWNRYKHVYRHPQINLSRYRYTDIFVFVACAAGKLMCDDPPEAALDTGSSHQKCAPDAR